MARLTALPHPSLQRYVETYWAVAADFSRVGAIELTPDCYSELVFTRATFSARSARGTKSLSHCFLVDLLDAPLKLEASGTVRCAAIRLRAGSARELFGEFVTAHEWPIVNRGDRLDSQYVTQIIVALEQGNWDRVVNLMDRFLLSRIPETDGKNPAEPFRAADAPSTGVVAEEMNLSRRQLERRVRRATGWSPKQLASLARFQRVRDALWEDASQSLAVLAVDSGYADQAHMSRQFRRYSGMTIRQFLIAMQERKDWADSDDVAFVQYGNASSP